MAHQPPIDLITFTDWPSLISHQACELTLGAYPQISFHRKEQLRVIWIFTPASHEPCLAFIIELYQLLGSNRNRTACRVIRASCLMTKEWIPNPPSANSWHIVSQARTYQTTIFELDVDEVTTLHNHVSEQIEEIFIYYFSTLIELDKLKKTPGLNSLVVLEEVNKFCPF